MTKKTKSNFRGKVANNAVETDSGNANSHLNLPEGLTIFKPEPETTVKMDIMPYEVTDEKHPDRNDARQIAMVGDLWYRRPYLRHGDVGPSHRSFICPRSVGKKCFICDYREKRIAAGADRKETDAMMPKRRYLYAIIVKGKKEDKIQLFDISHYLFQKKLNKELKNDSNLEIFPDLAEGLTLKVRFEPGEMPTKKPYAEADRIDFLEREEEYDESILEEIPNLDELLVIPSNKQLEAAFMAGEDEEDSEFTEVTDDDDDDEDRPAKKKPASKTRKKDEDDEEDEDDDEEDEKPSKRKPIKKRKDEDDDDEEQDDTDDDDKDDDEEEDESPRRKKTLKSKPKPKHDDDEEDEDSDDDNDEEEAPSRSRRLVKNSKTSGTKKKCPHGHTFGKDCEQEEECEDCKLWEACRDEYEKTA